jgi:hypothetical protein
MMAVSFAQDIRPLFTDMDIAHMKDLGVALDDLGYMRDPAHAQQVLDSVSTGAMPPAHSGEPPWSPQSVQLFRDWIAAGYQP